MCETRPCVLTLDVAVYGDKLRFAANCAISMDCSEFRWRMRFGKELVRVIVAKSRVKWQMRSKSFDIWQNNVYTIH